MRKKTYLQWINQVSKILLGLQDANTGCFFYPYAQRKTNYANARWQEGVLTLAWLWKKNKSDELKNKIISGLDFWSTLQHKNGSFPEYSKHDVSFSATAFSAIAAAETMCLIGESSESKNWLSMLRKAGDWLASNDELVLANQEAAAAVALLKIYFLLRDEKYLRAAEKKLAIVLNNQNAAGFYPEKGGFDFGYSSLTLELLGHYHLALPKDEIIASANKFLASALDSKHGQKNSRQTNWVIVDGFEIFSDRCENGPAALDHVLKNFDVCHLETDQNVCTDSYRLCWAHDNAKLNLNLLPKASAIGIMTFARPSKLLNVFRPFGLHKLRRYLP